MSLEEIMATLQRQREELGISEDASEDPYGMSIYDADEIVLESDADIDYSKLQSMLSKGRFRQADKLTYDLICKVMSKPVGSYFTSEEIGYFPDADLLTIDKLWNYYSNGQFGFSVQCDEFRDVGNDLDAFKTAVGWKDNIFESCKYPADDEMLQVAAYGFLPYLCNGKGKVMFIKNQIIVQDFIARLDMVSPE